MIPEKSETVEPYGAGFPEGHYNKLFFSVIFKSMAQPASSPESCAGLGTPPPQAGEQHQSST
jgi:hypothetical protein